MGPLEDKQGGGVVQIQGVDMVWSHKRSPMKSTFWASPSNRHVGITLVDRLAEFTVPSR